MDNYDGYQKALASMVYNFFDKKTVSGMSVNEQLAEEYVNQLLKTSKEKSIRDLKTIFGHSI